MDEQYINPNNFAYAVSAHYDVSEGNMYLEVPTAEEFEEELAWENIASSSSGSDSDCESDIQTESECEESTVTSKLNKAELICRSFYPGQCLDVLPNQHTEPFPSEQFALLYAFHHSSHPPVCHALEMIINYL